MTNRLIVLVLLAVAILNAVLVRKAYNPAMLTQAVEWE